MRRWGRLGGVGAAGHGREADCAEVISSAASRSARVISLPAKSLTPPRRSISAWSISISPFKSSEPLM